MHDEWPHVLETWHEFYLLIGTAGLTLTGLLFVIVSFGARTLADEARTGVPAFVSPNAVFFTTVLVVSAVFMVPGIPRPAVGWFLCAGSAATLAYLASTRAHRRWSENNLGALDWIWYIGLPVVTYLFLLASGIGLLRQAESAMGGAAFSVVLLLVVGIRNAWDLALWLAERQRD